MSKRAPHLLVADMLDAVERILSYTTGLDFDAFVQDAKTIDAVLRNLHVLGEAAKRVPEPIRERASDIEWERIIRSRHIVVHDYFSIDYEIVWRIVEVHLPPLHASLKALHKQVSSDGSPRFGVRFSYADPLRSDTGSWTLSSPPLSGRCSSFFSASSTSRWRRCA